MHRMWGVLCQVKTVLRGGLGNGIPSISPMYAQVWCRFCTSNPHVVHSKAGDEFTRRPAGSGPVAVLPRSTAARADVPALGVDPAGVSFSQDCLAPGPSWLPHSDPLLSGPGCARMMRTSESSGHG